jgi:CubicO group peptidase (beta-lactamase class C family)
MRVLGACLLGVLCAPAMAANDAPATTLASPPAELARAALGEWRGTAAVGVWRDGKASFAGDPTALYEIGSISKVFTGVLLAQAVERGDLSLDDTLGRLLAGKVTFTSDAVAAVTLRQLITHTSCMPRLPADFHAGGADMADPYRGYDRARLWKALAAMRFESAPPCTASYSNLGVGLVGELLSERYGQPWDVLVRERITGPLGMRDTVVALGDKAPRFVPGFAGNKPTPPWEMAAFVGAGGLRSTAADMLLFGRALLAGRSGPLGAAAERVVTPLARFDGDIGYALFVRGPAHKRTFTHNGGTGGYRSQLLLAADTGEVVIVLASNAEAPVDRLAADLLASRYPVPRGAPDAKANCLAECAGVYRIRKGAAYTFVVQDGVMHAHYTGRPFNALTPAGRDAFNHGSVARFVFQRNAAGRVQGLEVSSRGADLTAQRTDEPVPALATQPEAVLRRYVGRFALSPAMSFDVQMKDGQLTAKLGEQPRLSVYAVPGQPDRFTYDVVKAELQFERDADGAVRALVLHQNGVHRAPRTD